jgi:orotidine-5'-phosphate decarboxylase
MSGRIVLPLDVADLEAARALANRVGDRVAVHKIGLELFTAHGPAAVHIGAEHRLPVFLDLKLHDIPETVERAVAAAAQLGVRYLTVHASGGSAMLSRAVARAQRESAGNMIVLAVTVLTSLAEHDLAAQGLGRDVGAHVDRLVALALDAGVRGFVCSAHEVARVRARSRESVLVVPGVRPKGADAFDQARVATPGQAISEGADLLVIGRPIREAADPAAAADAINHEIAEALS